MPPTEPTRAQLSSRLAYTQTTPAFLRRLQNKVAGTAEEDDDDEFEDDGSGRPPIPKRPAIPQRPDDDPGSADEDDADEAPQVVVIKEGKHLNHWQVENEKRKAKGLPPLPRPSSPSAESATTHTSPKTQSAEPETDKPSSSSVSFGGPVKRTKRKAIGDADGDVDEAIAKPSSKKEGKKKQKKSKVGLSFADDAS